MNRMIVVVDEDIEPSDREEVLFAMTSRATVMVTKSMSSR